MVVVSWWWGMHYLEQALLAVLPRVRLRTALPKALIARASARGNLSLPQGVILNVSEESPQSRQMTTFTVCRRVGDPSLPLRMTLRISNVMTQR